MDATVDTFFVLFFLLWGKYRWGATAITLRLSRKTTRMALLGIFIFIQIASADVVLWRMEESQTVELSCPVPKRSTLSGLDLYHRSPHSQTTVLSLDRDGTSRVNNKLRGRLRLTGGLGSAQVNVTILHLEQSDTGLYLWEFTDQNNSEHIISDHKPIIFVEAAEKLCRCSSVYPPLLFVISGSAGLFLVIITWLTIHHCVKFKDHHKPPLSAPIYVEMTRKQQTTGVAQNIPETSSHLEEASFPVYANPNFIQPQDNYYACPRQLGLKAA